MTAQGLRPFWRYYGGKWRLAPRYPAPAHPTIVEPFAGAAGYSLRYPDREVILVEEYHVIAEIWRWLIGVSVDEVLAIPDVDAVAELPDWVPQPARWLVGFVFGAQLKRPQLNCSIGLRRRRHHGWTEGWTAPMRARVAQQVSSIRHWRVISGSYESAPNAKSTWFIDPPYVVAVRGYVHGSGRLDYPALGRWCRSRRGQVIVCESGDADWLPFRPFAETVGMGGKRSREAIWTRDDRDPPQLSLALGGRVTRRHACSSCDRPALSHGRGPAVLVILSSPHGEYALCASCMGRDGEPRSVSPTEPPRSLSTQLPRKHPSDHDH